MSCKGTFYLESYCFGEIILGSLVSVLFSKVFTQLDAGSHAPAFPREPIEVLDAGFPSLHPDPGSQISAARPGLRICLSLSFHVLPVLRPWSFTWSSTALGLCAHLGATLESPGELIKLS